MSTLDTLRTRFGTARAPICPRCDAPMRIKTITPTMFTEAVDEIEFRCLICEAETQKSVRRSA